MQLYYKAISIVIVDFQRWSTSLLKAKVKYVSIGKVNVIKKILPWHAVYYDSLTKLNLVYFQIFLPAGNLEETLCLVTVSSVR